MYSSSRLEKSATLIRLAQRANKSNPGKTCSDSLMYGNEFGIVTMLYNGILKRYRCTWSMLIGTEYWRQTKSSQ